MRRKIKYLMPVMLACSMMQFSCSDWTDPESINIHTPSMEEQNPELYAQYLESLNNFKATDHQVVIVSVNNEKLELDANVSGEPEIASF